MCVPSLASSTQMQRTKDEDDEDAQKKKDKRDDAYNGRTPPCIHFGKSFIKQSVSNLERKLRELFSIWIRNDVSVVVTRSVEFSLRMQVFDVTRKHL